MGSSRRSVALAAVVTVLLTVPLLAAVVFLRAEDWAPVHDMAWTELRVRDVGSANTPLVGLPGRLGRPEQPGSHPGPLSFYLLSPVYRLLGGSAWALEASFAALNAAAIFACVWMGRRRAGAAGVLAAGIGLALLVLGYGLSLLTEPWNPHFPVLWFAVFLLALWSIGCGETAMLPVLVLTGCICAQTHIPYMAVCGMLGAAAAFAALYHLRASARGSPERAQRLRWLAAACALLAVLWTPPVVDELAREPGNLGILADYFANAPSEPMGIEEAMPLVLSRLDAWFITVEQLRLPGGFSRVAGPAQAEPWRGGASVLVWAATVVLAAWLRQRALLVLHAVVAISVGVGVIAVSRIFGTPWPYLMYWAWSLGVLLIVACAATLFYATLRRLGPRQRQRVAAVGPWLGLAAVAICAVRLAVQAPDVRPLMGYRATKQLRALMPATLGALHAGTGTATGEAGRYLVTWSDALHSGAQAYGLLNELERAGFEAGVGPEHARLAGQHRVLAPEQATARVHLATGAWIKRWRRDRDAILVASSDLRTAEERAEFAALRRAAIQMLRELGRGDVLALLDRDLVAAGMLEPPLHPLNGLVLVRMEELGGPAAVFVAPAGTPAERQ